MACAVLGAGIGVRGDDRHDRPHAVTGEQVGDEADARHVGVPVLSGETETGAEGGAQFVAVEQFDAFAPLAQGGDEALGERRLARSGQAREPHGRGAHILIPHSTLSRPAQRPARASSPGATRRVQVAHPIDG